MKKILLIEDNDELRENAAEILRLSNYLVLQAKNGKKGLDIAVKENPDLIVCDIMMPVMDGYAVADSLQKHPGTCGIPFIFLSALADKNDLRKGMRAGADDYLTKPFEGIELLKAVEACLKKKERGLSKPGIGATKKGTPTIPQKPEGLLPDPAERTVHHYRKKTLLYLEGKRPAQVFYIISGKAKTYKMHEDGKEFITGIFGPGDFIGYKAILENTNYQDQAQVLEDLEVIEISRQEFLQLIESKPAIARQFIRLLVRDLAVNEESLLNLAYNSLRKRVANGLLMVLEKYKSGQDEFPSIEISRENLAHLVGSATESLTRVLGEFKDEKLIDFREGRIHLLNISKLKNLAN